VITNVDPKSVTPLLLSIVAAGLILRRMRRSFGPQAIRIGRLKFRAGVFAAVGVLVCFASIQNVSLLGALIGGIGIGAALGYLGLKHTKFEFTERGRFYTTHAYIGLLISALFIGRLIYRASIVYSATQASGQFNLFSGYQKSPLTLGILGLLIGYYICFNMGVVRRSRVLSQ
jgi:hypothetical protein